MAEAQLIDVTQAIDERKLGRFDVGLVLFCFCFTLLDGYDITAAAFAGPALVKAWGIANMAALAPVLSAGLFGILFGAPLFGYVGDRWGRNRALVIACLTMGVFTLAAMRAGDLTQLTALRFLAGFGIGGILPNAISLTAEYAPRRCRATMIIVMFTGTTLGGALPGPIAVWLLPLYGWPALFLVGGLIPLVLAVAAIFWLPESLKYLALKTERRAEMAKLVAALQPGLAIDAGARFVVSEEEAKASRPFTPKLLFSNGLAWLTILLWALFVCNQMAFYFVNSWLPTVLTSASIPMAHAAIANSLFQLGGTIGGLALARPLDKFGLTPVAILFVVAIFAASSIGFAREPETLLMIVVFVTGFCLLGLQFGLNAISALMYPVSFRSSGSGWAFGVGRFGSVSGPLFAGILIAMQLPIEHLFLFLAIPLTIGAICCIAMARLYLRRFQGMGLGRSPVPAE